MTDNLNNKEWFAAFDPGKVNFAFIIEEIDKNMIENILCPCPKKKDRFIKGQTKKDISPTEKYTDFLDAFYHCGQTITCVNSNITLSDDDNKEDKKTKKKGSKALNANIFLELTRLLDSYKEYFDKCSTIIIEQQMSFGSKINTMAIKIAQHTYSYFLFRYGNEKKIIEYPSYNKTQILGAPGGLDKPQRKKWAISKANEIWTLRGDLETLDMITSKKKKDDMSDCLLHVLAYIIDNYY